MEAICLIAALGACVIGKICGMGGGVIIKPAMDAAGLMSVAAVNFISGCTVVSMTCWSVGKSVVKKESQIDWAISTPLAVGAAFGGLLGKQLFSVVASLFANQNTAGGVQAALLGIATALTMLYTLKKDHITARQVRFKLSCAMIGLGLGVLGTFLGIGGGPFNMAVLYYFFSMSTKIAAQNSLYVILVSQVVGLLWTAIGQGIPSVDTPLLLGMMVCGIAGSEVGGQINRYLSEKRVTELFIAVMALVLAICAYNIFKYW